MTDQTFKLQSDFIAQVHEQNNNGKSWHSGQESILDWWLRTLSCIVVLGHIDIQKTGIMTFIFVYEVKSAIFAGCLIKHGQGIFLMEGWRYSLQ